MSTTARGPSPACCSTRPMGSGSGDRSGSRRTSSRPPGGLWWPRWSTPPSHANKTPRRVNEPIPLARPELGPREEELLLEVVRSGSLSLGPKLDRFERDFSDWIGGGVYPVAGFGGPAPPPPRRPGEGGAGRGAGHPPPPPPRSP